MKDVAALAGVGLSTVSRVVAGKPGVAEAKRIEIERAIAELGYRRNDVARYLRTGTNDTIGVVVTRISDPFYANLVSAIERAAHRRGVLVLVASATDDPIEAERVIRRLVRRNLDGLVIVAPEDADLAFLEKEIEDGLRVVFVDRPPRSLRVDQVVVDNERGMAAAVALLVGAGHRRIACMAHTTGRYTAEHRVEGYQAGLRDAGIALDPALVSERTEDVEGVVAELERLAALADPPTAIVTTNNRMTRAVLEAFVLRDEPLALIGFDDFEMAGLMRPPVTTIAQNPDLIGASAADLLFERIDGAGGPARRIVIDPHVIDRGVSGVA